MKRWPAGHGFAVFELSITDVWMIDFYGGGGSVDLELYRVCQCGSSPRLYLGLQTYTSATHTLAPIGTDPTQTLYIPATHTLAPIGTDLIHTCYSHPRANRHRPSSP